MADFEMLLIGATHKPHCWFRYEDLLITWSQGPNELRGSLTTRIFSAPWQQKETATLPMWTKIFTADPMALWCIRYTVNLPIPISMPAPVLISIPPTSMLYSPHWYTWPRVLFDHDSLHPEIVFLRTFFRQIHRALNPLVKVVLPNDNPDYHFPALRHVDLTPHQQGPCTTSGHMASCQEESLVSFCQSRMTWE
jgi:hypothetical protein